LPIYPDLQATDIEKIVSIIREFGRNAASEGTSYT
jgi:hypothetical protein